MLYIEDNNAILLIKFHNMIIKANLQKLENNNLEMDYMLAKFLQDVKDRVKPILVPSIEFVKAHFDNNSGFLLYEVDNDGNFFITTEGEFVLQTLTKEGFYNIKDLKLIFNDKAG